MKEYIIEINSINLRVDCSGSTSIQLHSDDRDAICFSGSSQCDLDTYEVSGKCIRVTPKVKIEERWFSYLDGEYSTSEFSGARVIEVLQSCGIVNIGTDLYRLPEVDIEEKEKLIKLHKEWLQREWEKRQKKRKEIAAEIEPYIGIIKDEQVRFILREYFLRDKGIFDIAEDTGGTLPQLEELTAAINGGVGLIREHTGNSSDSSRIWQSTF